MANKILDFDQFMSEADCDTITVRVAGETYEVKARIPAIVPVMMARAEKMADQSSRNAELSRLVFAAAEAFFGAEALDRICATGISVGDLSTLVQKLFLMINGRDEEEAQEASDEDSRTSLPGGNAKK